MDLCRKRGYPAKLHGGIDSGRAFQGDRLRGGMLAAGHSFASLGRLLTLFDSSILLICKMG